MTQRSEWPDFFPEGVPPDSATSAEGEAFRLVASIPPSDSDFLSNIEERPERKFKDDKIWIACGVSFHRQLECSKRTRNRYKPFRNRRIAKGTLKEEHGVQLPTNRQGDSHFTVWRRNGSLIHPDFIIDGEAS
ncbi:hypothetical protein [Synechococcus sp. PCC 7336]|uniref:hypothetical protein n=1 Tax=Synechococcus sp. PCC 7336 TaxID=195250 RepID=UPI0008FBF1FF|nr:hypothetical protein [Synechococcus sp. PCC 7336]